MSFNYKYEKIIADVEDDISSMAFLNDSTMIMAMSMGRLRKVDVETSEIIAEVACPMHIDSIEICGGVIVTGGSPCCGWDARTLEKTATYCEQATSIKIIPEKRRVLTGEYPAVVRMWDLDTGEFIAMVDEGTPETSFYANCIEYDAARNEVWYAIGNNIKCVNLISGEKTKVFRRHAGVVYVINKVGPDEFLSGGDCGQTFRWKPSDTSFIAKCDMKGALRSSCNIRGNLLLSTCSSAVLWYNTSTTTYSKAASNAHFLGPFVCASPSGLRFAYGKTHYELVICILKTD